jgi:hypothetical protein
LTVTATGSPLTVSEISTADGWQVTFDRVLFSIGYVSIGGGRGPKLSGDSCDVYAGASYGRILDLTLPGAQRVSEVFALGECEFGFRVPEPASNAVLGARVSEADFAFMRTTGTDSHVTDKAISLFVSGSAARGDESKEFRWAFRRPLEYKDCELGAGEEPGNVVQFAQDSPRVVDILIRAESLFRDELDEANAGFQFDAFALADDEFGNRDGEVALAELDNVPLTDSRVSIGRQSSGERPWKTLADWVYLGLVPTVPRVGGTGACSLEEGSGQSRGPGFL